MNKNLNRRSFLGILGGLIAGAVTGFKIDASPVIQEPLEKPFIPDYSIFRAEGYAHGKQIVLEHMVSNELLADSIIDLEKIIRQEFANRMAIEMDNWHREMEARIIFGTGAGEPVGILGASS